MRFELRLSKEMARATELAKKEGTTVDATLFRRALMAGFDELLRQNTQAHKHNGDRSE